MKLAAHQPNYIPWAHTFRKMSSVDVWVHMDSSCIPQGRSAANRAKVPLRHGTTTMTVPLARPRRSYIDTSVSESTLWRHKHRRTMKQRYGKSAYPYPVEVISDHVAASDQYCVLSALTIPIIEWIAYYLRIAALFRRASDMGLTGTVSEQIVGWCKVCYCNVYVSGASGRKYLDMETFRQNDVRVEFQELSYEPDISVIHNLACYGSRAL